VTELRLKLIAIDISFQLLYGKLTHEILLFVLPCVFSFFQSRICTKSHKQILQVHSILSYNNIIIICT